MGFIKSIFRVGQLKNFLILLFESKTELDGSIPKITSDPISEQTFKIFFLLILITFFLFKKFKILAAFIEPPPSPAFWGIFFVTETLNF